MKASLAARAAEARQRIRRFGRQILGRELWIRPQHHCALERLGSLRAPWTLCSGLLGTHSVIYSFGVGEEISFELALHERFGATVHAFDPTPRSLEWLRGQRLPAGVVVHPFGIADFDGTAAFTPPAKSTHVSYSMLSRPGASDAAVQAPVYRLASIAARLEHTRIDVLKMDVEGAEYAVIDDILASGVQVTQLLVEFHHRWPHVGLERTRRAVAALAAAGYAVVHVSPNGEEFTFLQVRRTQ